MPILEAIPGIEKVSYDAAQQEFRVKTREKGDERRLFIGNLIQTLRNGGDKEQRRETLRNYLLFFEAPSLFESPEIKDVLPVLRSDRLLAEMQRLNSEGNNTGNKKIELPYFSEMDGVIRVFVINAESSVAYVSLNNLDKWKITKEKLSEVAFSNLRAYYEKVPIRVEKDENFSIVSVDNFFETSVALIDTFWEKQRDENDGAPVALFLARNIVVFTHEKNERGLMLLRRYAQTADEIPYELSRNLFRWTDRRWEVLTETKELELIRQSGMRAFPPRLPDQPIFYPVLTEDYAVRIARDWNVPASGSGYVTRFRVRKDFLDRYVVQEAGGRDLREYWIPADDLPDFSAAIVGEIEVVRQFPETA